MYISKIQINNFRNFKQKETDFNDGINVIIGHNNAGKTNLIKALSLVIDTQKPKRLEVDDFNKNLTLAELKVTPPKISIAVTIRKGNEEEPDDLVTISNWLTKLDSSYEALLTYEFFLPEKKQEDYLKAERIKLKNFFVFLNPPLKTNPSAGLKLTSSINGGILTEILFLSFVYAYRDEHHFLQIR